MTKKLVRSNKQKKLFGVCGGIAEYLNMDVTLMRIVYLVFVFMSGGTGILAYFICALIMPAADEVSNDVNVDNLKSANIHENNTEGKAHSDSEFDSYFK